VAAQIAPLLSVIASPAYQVVLDLSVIAGLAWAAAAFDLPRKTRVATAWLIPAAFVASLWSERHTDAAVEAIGWYAGPLAGAALAGLVLVIPSELEMPRRGRLATALAAAITAASLVLFSLHFAMARFVATPWPNWLWPTTVMVVAAIASALAGWSVGRLRWRSRALLGGVVAVVAGAIAWRVG